MRRRTRLVGTLWRWHRRIGVLAAVFVLLLAVTGITLNHSPQLGLDHRLVSASWLYRLYGDTSSAPVAYRLGNAWLSRTADGRLYLDTREVATCEGDLVGAASVGELLLAACTRELVLLTDGGELLESNGAGMGLPVPLAGIGLVGERVALRVAGGWRLADLDQLDFDAPVPAGATVAQQTPAALPASIRAAIPAPEAWLSWERVLLDLHSGRLFGAAGVALVDAVGVLLVVLAGSGLAMWWLHRRRVTRPRN
jgi:hypothetical protein